jgi:predicted SnoaL-like aldol condensation-catalyzing enzyme
MQGLVNYIKNLTWRFPEYWFDVKNIIVDGDFVILHSHATLRKDHRWNENKGFIITDTFRLENGNLVEHWDAIQPIDFLSRCIFLITGGEKWNNNSIF